MSHDGSAGYDDAYYRGNQQSGDRLALRFYARIASRLAPPGAEAFEFGSGTGHLSKRLARRFSASAYDLSPYARAETHRTSPATHIVDDLDSVVDASFDLVVSLHVLEHVPDPSATLRQMARWTRPGGHLLYVVPNPEGLGHRIKKKAWFAYRDDSHCSLLGRDEWLDETTRAGFRIERAAADGLWDAPYVRRLPRALQMATFGAPAAIQVALGRALLPRDWGECLIVVARRI
jgi:2-polyprenyl-3-methyl-5-hydroxy-6-metoxy-1,4-benzoquinol methylase